MSNGQNNQRDPKKFKALLEESYIWPTYYLFKFIIPKDSENDLRQVFASRNNCKIDVKPSKNGNYLSLSINILMKSPDDVLEIYNNVSKVKGIMSL